MSQDKGRETDEKRKRDVHDPLFAQMRGHMRDGIDPSSKPERQRENPMRFFETARATPRPKITWTKHGNRCASFADPCRRKRLAAWRIVAN